jgi:hypothetical protein
MVGLTRSQRLLSRWLLPALAGAVALLLVRIPGEGPDIDPRFSIVSPVPKATEVPASLDASVAFRTADLGEALQSLRGQLPETEWRALRRRVDDACVVPSLLRLEGRREADPRRDWARDALVERCAGLPMPSLYRPGIDVRNERTDQWPLPSPDQALARLRQARTSRALADAWIDAYLVDALPQERIFSDGRRLLPADAEAVIAVVQDWRDCARFTACGSGSLLTLKVCAMHGCDAGADLLEAWFEALLPRDFSAARAVHAWLLQEVPIDAR